MTPIIKTPQARLRAGVARCDITPPVGIYHRMWGAALQDRATAVHKPLLATALWLAPIGNGRPLLLVALDHCVIDGAEMKQLREKAAEAVGIPVGDVSITLSHTHGSGWMSRTRSHLPGGDMIGTYFDGIVPKIAEISQRARDHAQAATLVAGASRCSLGRHRDFWDEASRQYVCGFNPEGPSDDTLILGRLTDDAGNMVATIVNYACHPTTLAWENSAISPDYVGAMRELVERDTGAPCLFLQGASGDLGPREGYSGDLEMADRNGRKLGYAALAGLEDLPPAGTDFHFLGPVVSGATLGVWENKPQSADRNSSQSHWRCENLVVDLPYRSDLPTIAATETALADWRRQEDEARSRGDEAAIRDCRAHGERMRRQLTRLHALPGGKTYPFPVRLWRMGDIAWVVTPGELYQHFQQELRRARIGPVFVVTLTNDWQPGYIPIRSAYGKGIYQETISPMAPGALELLTEATVRALVELA